jgi:signal transduction histidine kinase
MFAAKASCCMRLPEFTRTTTFHWTLAVSAALAAFILLTFGIVLVQTRSFISAEQDDVFTELSKLIASVEPERRVERVDLFLSVDPRHTKIGGLFAVDGTRITGNIESLPPGFQADAIPRLVLLVRIDASGSERRAARAVGRRLPEGGTLVIGRGFDEFASIADIVRRTVTLGLVPALCLSLAVGGFLSVRAERRVREVNRSIHRIVSGELRERLPSRGTNDAFDRLASLVNGMLDDIEALIRGVAGVGDDIAHDLRTPLTRVRISLERARQRATLEELRMSVDQAILGLDQSLAIITALLRIAEIEHSRRLAGFRDVALAELVREVGDLYEPIAEDKNVSFAVEEKGHLVVHGDRDLLFEAIANLVDNAIKYTPEGGRIELRLLRKGDEAVVRVSDSGPGIAADERNLVARRFYRSDKSRRNPGLGLGLSLVTAIVKLHGFRFSISAGPNCVAEITGRQAST